MGSVPHPVVDVFLFTCTKRDGKEVSFDINKISNSVKKCIQSFPHYSLDEAEKISQQVLNFVYNKLFEWQKENKNKVHVEEIQDVVVDSLHKLGYENLANAYSSYRQKHKNLRETSLASFSDEEVKKFSEMKQFFTDDLQVYQFFSKFSRWLDSKNRRETWQELVCDRVIPWFKKTIQRYDCYLEENEWEFLKDSLLYMKASPALRILQLAGPALDRCHVGVYNCAYMPIDSINSLPEMLYILMQGTGVGFSVESHYVNKLPKIKEWDTSKPKKKIVVEDTTEGWCDAYKQILECFWDGVDIELDVSKVRKKGSILKTKGGYASGPEPFAELVDFTRNVFYHNQGKYLADTDVHRLACFVGRIVQVGGVRRAATISLSDLASVGMRHIKSGSWWDDQTYWKDGLYLSMANNSAVYDFRQRVPIELFMEEWLALVKSRSGERGIFNRQAANLHRPERRLPCEEFGCNPCAEIVLRPYEFCNLSIAVARPDDTPQTLLEKVRAATYFGVLQSLCTDFNYINKKWKENCIEERLLGVDITGQADCPLLQYGAPGRAELLKTLKEEALKVAQFLAKRFKINMPAAVTTIKPSGDSSVLFNCSSGVSPRFAKYYRRWVRESQTSPMSAFLIDSGVPYHPAPESPENLYVFAFPKASPPVSKLRNDMSAIDQLENWLEWKTCWAEHSVSATIYVDDHEWLEVGAWVYKHIDHITGLSFLPKDNGTYKFAPHEEMTEEEYKKFLQSYPEISWIKLSYFDSLHRQPRQPEVIFDCSSDKCVYQSTT